MIKSFAIEIINKRKKSKPDVIQTNIATDAMLTGELDDR